MTLETISTTQLLHRDDVIITAVYEVNGNVTVKGTVRIKETGEPKFFERVITSTWFEKFCRKRFGRHHKKLNFYYHKS